MLSTVKSVARRIPSFAARLRRCESGNAAMVMMLLALPLFAGAGLAIDTARAFVVESRMAKALDAAGLAAGRVVLEDRMEQDARAYFAANYPDGLLGSDIDPDEIAIRVDANNEFIELSAATRMPTRFMRVFGQEYVDVEVESVIQRLVQGAEIALVMDNTGSMQGHKMTTMKTAALDLVDIVFAGETAYDHLWWSLVPYSSTVNIGQARTDWLVAGDRAKDPSDPFSPSEWKGCVEARWASGRDETDDPPNVERFTSFFYESTDDDGDWQSDGNDWPPVNEAQSAHNAGTGPNLGCGPEITPLTNQKSEVDDAIEEMQAWHRGGTTSNLGLVWGWRTISPRWRGWWDNSPRPVDYDDELIKKVAIVLTDGENQFFDYDNNDDYVSDYTGYGRVEDFIPGATNERDGLDTLDGKFADVCAAMKREGIILYTITFGGGASSIRIRTLFEACASDPGNFFHAPSANDLRDAFRSIGQELSNLRIVK